MALLGVASACDSTTRIEPNTPAALAGSYSLVTIDGYPANLFCTVWIDPDVGAALNANDSDAYFFMYVNATLTFREPVAEVDISHRLVSCGGAEPETFEVDVRRAFERRESLILISQLAGTEAYADTAWLRGDTVFVRALRFRRGLDPRGNVVLAYTRDP